MYVNRSQQGYILMLVLVLLTVLSVAASQFMTRSQRATQMVSNASNSSASLNLAEAALNTLAGRFTFGDDLNNDGTPDNEQAVFDPSGEPNLPYLFFVSTAGDDIDQTAPSILQKVANGETLGVSQNLNSRNIPATIANLNVAGMFGAGFKPRLYVQQGGGFIVSNNDWNNETAYSKAAVWLEMVASPVVNSQVNVYVAAVGQVGESKSYLQRFVGAYGVQMSGGKHGGTMTQKMQHH